MVHVEKENMQVRLQLDDPGAQQRRLAEIKRTNEAADDLLDLSRILFIRLMMLDSKIDLRVNPLNRFYHDFKPVRSDSCRVINFRKAASNRSKSNSPSTCTSSGML